MSDEAVEVATEVTQSEDAVVEAQSVREPDITKALAQTTIAEKSAPTAAIILPKSK